MDVALNPQNQCVSLSRDYHIRFLCCAKLIKKIKGTKKCCAGSCYLESIEDGDFNSSDGNNCLSYRGVILKLYNVYRDLNRISQVSATCWGMDVKADVKKIEEEIYQDNHALKLHVMETVNKDDFVVCKQKTIMKLIEAANFRDLSYPSCVELGLFSATQRRVPPEERTCADDVIPQASTIVSW
ncbi:hypothetical protein SADUNF_Sadunf10G0140200 [Salix dunnii]|uniref:Uncharacterized protein n=1 Tax=Salix dunnii TaxID=1413687 RepID=A0A835JNR9_9ROSI|nr:hypothetical protein SADUNF_Sadunf10G0140200 [Salix dunnii]